MSVDSQDDGRQEHEITDREEENAGKALRGERMGSIGTTIATIT